jgi:hypothetical protein
MPQACPPGTFGTNSSRRSGRRRYWGVRQGHRDARAKKRVNLRAWDEKSRTRPVRAPCAARRRGSSSTGCRRCKRWKGGFRRWRSRAIAAASSAGTARTRSTGPSRAARRPSVPTDSLTGRQVSGRSPARGARPASADGLSRCDAGDLGSREEPPARGQTRVASCRPHHGLDRGHHNLWLPPDAALDEVVAL